MNHLERYRPGAWYADVSPIPERLPDGAGPFVRVISLPNRDEPECEGTAVVVVGGCSEPDAPGAFVTVLLSIYGRPFLPDYSIAVKPALAKMIALALEPPDCSPEGLEALGFHPED